MKILSVVGPQAGRKRRKLTAGVWVEMLSLLFVLVSSRAFTQDLPLVGHQGSLDFSVCVTGETGEETTNSLTQAQILSATVSAGWVISGLHGNSWRRGNLEYAFDLIPLFETWGNQRVHGGGFDPVVLRWNSALHTNRISPYIELAGGVVITNSNLPPGKTSNLNFMAKGGGGIYIRTRKRESLDIGFRWSHISNANLGLDNPEFNGVQLSLGYHWFK